VKRGLEKNSSLKKGLITPRELSFPLLLLLLLLLLFLLLLLTTTSPYREPPRPQSHPNPITCITGRSIVILSFPHPTSTTRVPLLRKLQPIPYIYANIHKFGSAKKILACNGHFDALLFSIYCTEI
jgi:hypothetical protein